MVTMTESAVSHLKEIMSKEGREDVALRVYVTPGGCSGFSYGMSLDDERADDDETFDYQGVKVVVDPFSLQYLEAAKVDYTDALIVGGLTVQNPNAVKMCSCEQSFDESVGGGQLKPCS